MSCPQGEEMACVQLRSSLISKVLETKEELCPGISTTELLIDPSNLSSYPLPNSSELTLYTMADQVVNAVRECKQFIIDITGRKNLKLVNALHFEPYHGMQTRLIDQLFDKTLANQEVDDSFLHDLAASIHPKLMRQVPIEIVLRMFNISDGRLFYNYCDQFPDERDNPIMRCFRLLSFTPPFPLAPLPFFHSFLHFSFPLFLLPKSSWLLWQGRDAALPSHPQQVPLSHCQP